MSAKLGNDKAFQKINVIILVCVLLISLYPLIYVLSASFSDPAEVLNGHMVLWPKGFNLESYQRVFEHEEIMRGYLNSIYYTVVGTAINMVMTVLCAYPLSRKDMEGRGLIMAFVVFTMYFSGGLIPTYLVVSKWLKLRNTVWAIVLPGAISVYNMLIVRSYFINSIPSELNEAARIDGCSDMRLLIRIVLPLSAPVLAVVGMYYLVGHWNSWFSALIYMTSKDRYPLQLVLKSVLVDGAAEVMLEDVDMASYQKQVLMAESIKYAVIVTASAPVLILYPFLQKFFVKGVMVGAIKG